MDRQGGEDRHGYQGGEERGINRFKLSVVTLVYYSF